jgi:disulfide bond formation protein DsbB
MSGCGAPLPVVDCQLPVTHLMQRPIGEIARLLLLGSPDCVSISWSFLDLTLPEWSLLAFLLLARAAELAAGVSLRQGATG